MNPNYQQVVDVMDERKIALIGCGKMGSAMARGWLSSANKYDITVVDPNGIPDALKAASAQTVDTESTLTTYEEIADLGYTDLTFDVVVIAVKPQVVEFICDELKTHLAPHSLVLSIAAGVTIENFESHFSPTQPIVRAMPNTPAAIGKGITVAVPNRYVNDEHIHVVAELLRSTGDLEWVEDEGILNAVTALSGSGPAYLFLLVEAMTEAGVKMGIPQDLANRLARKTVLGASSLALTDNKLSAAELRENVTSPGGTTEAALKILMHNDVFKTLVETAMRAAEHRGEELSSN